MSVIYTDHLLLRLKLRKIPDNYPTEIYEEPDQRFYDNLEGNFISIKKLKYNTKIRNMMIAYEKKGNDVEIITIHPIKDEQIINRVINGRWLKK